MDKSKRNMMIKKFAGCEYFTDHFDELIENIDFIDFDNSFWREIQEGYKYSPTYERFFNKQKLLKICSEDQQKELLKDELPQEQMVDSYWEYLNSRCWYDLLLLQGAVEFAKVDGSDIDKANDYGESLLTWIKLLDPRAFDDFSMLYQEDFYNKSDKVLKNIFDRANKIYKEKANNLYEKCVKNCGEKEFNNLCFAKLQDIKDEYLFLTGGLLINTTSLQEKKAETQAEKKSAGKEEGNQEKAKDIKSDAKHLISIDDAIAKNFEGLFGFDDVKQHLHNVSNAILKYSKMPFHLNYCLTGNPGVGKTTIAKAISNTYFDCGILKNNNLMVINSAELKGKYVGQTAPKVKELFEKIHGGAVFLDEAYVLAGDQNGSDSFAQEAVTQLMKEIDYLWDKQEKDPADRTMIAIAGYKEPIERFLVINPGMEGRLNKFQFHLDDYSSDQLFAFFEKKFAELGVQFDNRESVRDVFDKYIDLQKGRKNFANVRTVKNLFESSLLNQAGRKDSGNILIADDVAKSLNEIPQKKKNFIGFGDRGM